MGFAVTTSLQFGLTRSLLSSIMVKWIWLWSCYLVFGITNQPCMQFESFSYFANFDECWLGINGGRDLISDLLGVRVAVLYDCSYFRWLILLLGSIIIFCLTVYSTFFIVISFQFAQDLWKKELKCFQIPKPPLCTTY